MYNRMHMQVSTPAVDDWKAPKRKPTSPSLRERLLNPVEPSTSAPPSLWRFLTDPGVPSPLLQRLIAEIKRLAQLQDGWRQGSSLAPNFAAVCLAQFAATHIAAGQMKVDRVVASADGGITFYFFGSQKTAGGAHERYASLTCSNEKVIVALTGDRSSQEPATAWEVSLSQINHTLGKIVYHLSA